MTKPPTPKQAATRCLDFHERLLAYAMTGSKVDFARMDTTTQRGYETAYRTIRKWGAFDGEAITDLGRAIVAQIVINRPGGIADIHLAGIRQCPECKRPFAMLYICERCGRCDELDRPRDNDRITPCCKGTCEARDWRNQEGR